MNTRDIILEKTMLLILERKSIEISMNDIKDATGIAIGGIYYHFKNKDELFGEIIEKYMVNYLKMDFDSMDLNNKTSKEKIHIAFLTLFKQREDGIKIEVADEEIDYRQIVNLLTATGHKHKRVIDVIAKYGDELFEFVREIVEEGQKNKEIRQDYPSEIIAESLVLKGLGINSMWLNFYLDDYRSIFERQLDFEWENIKYVE